MDAVRFGLEVMSLFKHVASKNPLLDLILDGLVRLDGASPA